MWRSGLGVTADGALVYVGGPGLDIADLANILVRAGAVRAMELDINTDWVNYSTYQPSTPDGGGDPRQRHRAPGGNDGYPGSLLPAVVGPGLHHHVGGGPVTHRGPRPARPAATSASRSRPCTASSRWRARSTPGLIVRAMRPRQWIKNLLVFMAPAAAGVLGDWHTTVRVVAAFVVFCLVASGTYLVNDVIDADSDRIHPDKRRRPVASGALRHRTALGTGASLIAVAVAAALFIGPWGFAVVVGSYASLSIAYSLRFKREPVVELAVVASCFVLRAVAGGVVAQVPLSNWFLVFTSFAALFVVTGKRYAEHTRLGHDRGEHRQVLDQYTESFLKSTLTISATRHRRLLLPVGLRSDGPAGARRPAGRLDRAHRDPARARRPPHLPPARRRSGWRTRAAGPARSHPPGLRVALVRLHGHRAVRMIGTLEVSPEPLCGWGRTMPTRGLVSRPADAASVELRVPHQGHGVIARGLGRSYGDAAQCSGGLTIDTAGLSHIGVLDESSGTIEVGGGVSLHDLMRAIIPSGWFVAVTPGTRYVSVGGAIAADVHGKNHHRDGSFARHVVEMTLVTPSGTFTCPPSATRTCSGPPPAAWG